MNTRTRIANGTKVLNLISAMDGIVINAEHDPVLGWWRYTVNTRYGIRRWMSNDVIPYATFLSDIAPKFYGYTLPRSA